MRVRVRRVRVGSGSGSGSSCNSMTLTATASGSTCWKRAVVRKSSRPTRPRYLPPAAFARPEEAWPTYATSVRRSRSGACSAEKASMPRQPSSSSPMSAAIVRRASSVACTPRSVPSISASKPSSWSRRLEAPSPRLCQAGCSLSMVVRRGRRASRSRGTAGRCSTSAGDAPMRSALAAHSMDHRKSV